MAQKKVSLVESQAIQQFYSELETFVREALETGFADIAAANKFGIENQKRRIVLKQRAVGLKLDFEFEASRIQNCLIAEAKKELERQNQNSTEAL
jgi:hypothetical protein